MDLKRWDEAELLAPHDILSDVRGPLGVRTQGVADRPVGLYTSLRKPEIAAAWRRRSKP